MFVVKWVTQSGEPGWFEVDDVHGAIGHVELLRNRDGVDGAQIFKLEHVAFEFKPYYRVELAPGATAPAPAATPAAAPAVSFAASIAPDPAPVAEPEPVVDPEPVAVAAPEPVLEPEPVGASVWGGGDEVNGNHRRGLFGR